MGLRSDAALALFVTGFSEGRSCRAVASVSLGVLFEMAGQAFLGQQGAGSSPGCSLVRVWRAFVSSFSCFLDAAIY